MPQMPTNQTEAIPGREHLMGKNSAGGVTFLIDKWKRLDRYLVLGTDKGSYYATERELKLENSGVVKECIAEDGLRTVARIVEISDQGRAPKNDQAIYALALCLKHGDHNTKIMAQTMVPKVCRIGTHIFQLADYLKQLGVKMSRGMKRGMAGWYRQQDPERLAMNLVKYQNREGWTHKDLLRVAHVKNDSPAHETLTRWVACDGNLGERKVFRYERGASPADCRGAKDFFLTSGQITAPLLRVDLYPALNRNTLPQLIEGFEEMKRATAASEVIRLVQQFGLPRETVPTQFLNDKEVWEALLYAGEYGMPMTAMIRNLGKMSEVGLLAPMTKAAGFVAQRLTDVNALKHARVHPLALLMALCVYKQGHGMRGQNTWPVNQKIVDALNDAFYLAFQFVVPTGRRHLLGIDVSGSMGGGTVGGTPLTPRECSGAMAMVTARTEPEHHFFGFSNRFVELDISPRMRLDDVVAKLELPFETTDCSLPMIYALGQQIRVDAFVVYTDSETYAGRMQPVQALQQYRDRMGIPAKLVVVGLTSNGFSIADPEDGGMLDIVGMDAAAPQVMSDFIRE
jgi:60 kDa SS-A/Ro ribonucleoprotein